MRKYLAIAKIAYRLVMESRLNIVISNLQSVFSLFILFFFWQAVFRNQSTVKGYTFPEIVTYYFLVRVTYNRISTMGAARIAKEIKSGEISNFLLRPYDYILLNLAKHLTQATLWVAGNLVAISVFSIYLYGFLVSPASPTHLLLFLLVFVVNGFLSALINIAIGLSAFWLGEITHLKILSTQIIAFLSGGLIPLTFFPEWFQQVSNFLPFRFLVQFPADVYFGKINPSAIVVQISILIGWTISTYLLSHYLLRKGLKDYESFN